VAGLPSAAELFGSRRSAVDTDVALRHLLLTIDKKRALS